jgi:hypothetical protein
MISLCYQMLCTFFSASTPSMLFYICTRPIIILSWLFIVQSCLLSPLLHVISL